MTAWLQAWEELQLAGAASGLSDADEAIRQKRPDAALVDFTDPDQNGIRTLQLCVSEGIASLAFSSDREPSTLRAALRAGARGFFLETSSAEEVKCATVSLCEGRSFFCSRAAGTIVSMLTEQPSELEVRASPHGLTPRETRVLVSIAEGHTSKEIASLLGISYRTVEAHRQRISEKIGVKTIAGLTEFAIASGLYGKK